LGALLQHLEDVDLVCLHRLLRLLLALLLAALLARGLARQETLSPLRPAFSAAGSSCAGFFATGFFAAGFFSTLGAMGIRIGLDWVSTRSLGRQWVLGDLRKACCWMRKKAAGGVAL